MHKLGELLRGKRDTDETPVKNDETHVPNDEDEDQPGIEVVASRETPEATKRVQLAPVPWPYSFDVEFAVNLFGHAVRKKETLILQNISGQAKIDAFAFLKDKQEEIKYIQRHPNALHAAMIQNLKNEWSKLCSK